MGETVPAQHGVPPPADPLALLRSRSYVGLLVLAAVLGVPISAAAYFFLQLTHHIEQWVYTDLPDGLGFEQPPTWWPAPLLVIAGLLVGLIVRYLPGRGGPSPADGVQPHGVPSGDELLGIALAALATLGLGAVLGPEAPLIALGAGLAAVTLRLARRDTPAQVVAVVGLTGSFAAVSTLLGSPLLGAFLLLEVSGLGGATAALVLVPGLLAAGLGTLIFIGLDSWTGLGPVSLAVPDLPAYARPDVAQFGWALVIGAAAAPVGWGLRRLAHLLKPATERHPPLVTPVLGLGIAGLAIAYAEVTGHSQSDVLFSGQGSLSPLINNSADYTVDALLLLLVCKCLAYSASLAGFRGGPIFPAMFVGAAGGLAMSHLPGLPVVAAAAMGIGALCVVMLRLPLTSVLLATLLLAEEGLAVMPLVIVAVVVAYVVSAWLQPPPPAPASTTAEEAAPRIAGAPPPRGARRPAARPPPTRSSRPPS